MKLFTNLIYLTGAEVLSKILTFAAIAYMARVLGPDGYGYFEFAAAVLMCASLIVDQGFSTLGAREIAKAPERTPRLIAEIVSARFLLAILAFVGVVLFTFWLNPAQAAIPLLLTNGASLLLLPFLFQWVFQGHDEMRLVAALQLLRQSVFAAVVILFLHDSLQLWWAGLAEIAGVIAAAALGLWMYQRSLLGRLVFRPTLSRNLFREGVPIGLSQVFWVVKMSGATVLVGLVASPQDVGFFGGAMRILVALHAFVFLYYFNLLPSMSREYLKGMDGLGRMIHRSLRLVVPASVAVGLAWWFAAPAAMTLVYGPAFALGGIVLRWFAVVWVAAALSGHYRFALIASGHQAAEMVSSILGALIVLAGIPLGYSQAGIVGAALAVVAAELAIGLSAWVFARHFIRARAPVFPTDVSHELNKKPQNVA